MKPPFRALLVDDEAPARARLRTLLAAHPEVAVLGEANSVAEAARQCARLHPNLLFLDIQMPREDGFALLPKLEEAPAIIFVTAHDRFAVRAFEVNAADYLLKPVHPDRLALALRRLAQPRAEPELAQLRVEDTVFLRTDRELRVVPVDEITHIEAEENYTLVHVMDGSSVLVRRGIAQWEGSLPAERFVRVHRSLIVNHGAVRSLVAESRDSTRLEITGRPTPLILARRASLRLRRSLEH
jgi:two-component system LytT family response regulator